MTPWVLVVYTNTLFAEGLIHLLMGRADCVLSGVLPIGMLSADRLAETPATAIILEGDDADPAISAAMRLLGGQERAFTLIRINLNAPNLHVYRFDRPVPAGLEELTAVIHQLAGQPTPAVMRTPLLEGQS